MGHHMMHGSGDCGNANWTHMFAIPMPMAMFGMLTAAMFGMTMGVMMGKKAGMHGKWHGPWKKGMYHHHHGAGPACCCSDWKGETATEEEQTAE